MKLTIAIFRNLETNRLKTMFTNRQVVGSLVLTIFGRKVADRQHAVGEGAVARWIW